MVRLREDLGTQVLKQTQEQSAQVMGSATTMIEQKISQSLVGFRQQVTQQLQTVAQNAQGLSEEIAEAVGQHFNSGAEKFQQQVAEAGNRAGRKGEEHFLSLQKRLGEEHDAYRAEMQKMQNTVAAEVSRLQAQATSLGGRMAAFPISHAGWNPGMETLFVTDGQRLQISAARVQLETAVDVVLKELGTRNAKELDRQLDEARGKFEDRAEGNRNLGERSGQDGSRGQLALLRADHGRAGTGFRGTLAQCFEPGPDFRCQDSWRRISDGGCIEQVED